MTSATAVAAPCVLHQPNRHPYVDRLRPAARAPSTADAMDPWDPSTWSDEVGIVHVHFGFEQQTVEQLDSWLASVRRRGTALVYTLHDFDNPHLVDQAPYHRLVRTLVTAADRVTTLTPSVAALARAALGTTRAIEVIAHPPIFDRPTRPDRRSRSGVYVHAATLRPNLDLDVLVTAARAAARWGGLRVHVRRGSAGLPRPVTEAIELAGGRVEVEARLTDAELAARIGSARLLVIPYRWGTHSGLLEAAADLGTPAAAPPLGGFADQGASVWHDGDIAAAMERAVNLPPVPPADRRSRRDAAVARHLAVYRDLR